MLPTLGILASPRARQMGTFPWWKMIGVKGEVRDTVKMCRCETKARVTTSEHPRLGVAADQVGCVVNVNAGCGVLASGLF